MKKLSELPQFTEIAIFQVGELLEKFKKFFPGAEIWVRPYPDDPDRLRSAFVCVDPENMIFGSFTNKNGFQLWFDRRFSFLTWNDIPDYPSKHLNPNKKTMERYLEFVQNSLKQATELNAQREKEANEFLQQIKDTGAEVYLFNHTLHNLEGVAEKNGIKLEFSYSNGYPSTKIKIQKNDIEVFKKLIQ